jgi:hypothetical protein
VQSILLVVAPPPCLIGHKGFFFPCGFFCDPFTKRSLESKKSCSPEDSGYWENFSAGWNYYPILAGMDSGNFFVFNAHGNGRRDAI